MMSKIKLICFDLGGVLVQLNPNFRQRLQQIARPEELARLNAIMRDDFQHHQDHFSEGERYQLGQLSTSEFLTLVSQTLGGRIAPADIRQIIDSQIAGQISETVRYLEPLSRKVRLACFSNTNATHWEVMTRFPWMDLFEFKFGSHLVGCAKPHPSAYRKIAEAAQVQLGECLFIDDRQVNVEAALGVGMEAHLFQSSKALEEQFARLDIIFG